MPQKLRYLFSNLQELCMKTGLLIFGDLCTYLYNVLILFFQALWVGDLDLPRETSGGRGKLLARLYNLRRTMTNCGLISTNATKKSTTVTDVIDQGMMENVAQAT